MYIPAHFKESRIDVMHNLINAHSLATLIVLTDQGLEANHIPFFLSEEGEFGILRGHVARANPVWQDFKPECEGLAVFSGEQRYITPSWYPAKKESGKVVPTWNYTVVHAYGDLKVRQEASWIRSHLEELTNRHESSFEEHWKMSDAPEDFIERLMAAIVGIEITISRLEGKWKVSQNQPEQNRSGVALGLRNLVGGDCPMAGLVEVSK
jgi:transcriptional regulator